MTDRLNVSVDKPFIFHPCTGQKVHVMFDPPHLIKCLRNNLINNKITVQVRDKPVVADSLKTFLYFVEC